MIFTILGLGIAIALILLILFWIEVKRIEKDYAIFPGNNTKIRQLLRSGNPITLYSTGGLTSYALKVAQVVHDQKIEIVVDRECTSACSELILPAAHRVTFKNRPLIGFHTNILADEVLHKKTGY